jgi:hypothetical protein
VDHADVILWFLTDPMRDPDGGAGQPTTLRHYHGERRRRLADSMASMARLVGDRPVWLVGGVCDVPDWVTRDHPGWRVVVPDLLRWLVPTNPISATHLNRCWPYPDCEPALLDYHEAEERAVSGFRWRAEHRTHTDEHRYWWPDGVHPNREAHRRLCDELLLPLL